MTKKIKVYGMVQGVGFRPLVYRIAQNLNIKGYVKNIGGYVEITAQAEEEVLETFLDQLKRNQSNGCEIIRLETTELPYEELQDFIIVTSDKSEEISIIPPDLPVCAACSKELYDNNNRRFHNPFISCMSCGPRYTIMEELPYDRQNTTMIDYKMCPDCLEEYSSPRSRRFHAQTISCNECGPYLIYQDMTKSIIEQEVKSKIEQEAKMDINKKTKPLTDQMAKPLINQMVKPLINQMALDKAVNVLKCGGILAVKGIGGYHFVCSPFVEDTVINLRKLKGREEKPFAVMFPSMEEIKRFCIVSEEESSLLESAARPIVLLYMQTNTLAPSVNRESIYCGAFLPYTPLQMMLTDRCGPLIMTSANISDQPVIREDEKLLSLDLPYLEGVLYHTRRIVRSVDDSVAKVIDGKPQLIRRSRGYVPYPVFIGQECAQSEHELSEQALSKPELTGQESHTKIIFAAGADLKAAFCLYKDGNAVVSQYFGDLAEFSVMEEYKKSFIDLAGLLNLRPTYAVCDLHPNYSSTHFAKSLGLPVLQVQHHHAHIASVMAEHELKNKVIGVAFDGTGYGTDGNIWGGEFMICEGAGFIRAAHLKYMKILGGDQSMRDAKKTATCYLLGADMSEYIADERIDMIKTALGNNINTILSSSMGRLFDAVASIIGVGQESRYEGECAALLEKEAVLALKDQSIAEKLTFAISEKDEIIEIDSKPLLEALCRLSSVNYKKNNSHSKFVPAAQSLQVMKKDVVIKMQDTKALALGFHYATAEMITVICEKLRTRYGTDTIALSGGVFQNTILTEQTCKLLRRKGFEVYLNRAVPPNDGAISLGQTYIGLKSMD